MNRIDISVPAPLTMGTDLLCKADQEDVVVLTQAEKISVA
jgi:hypothetical protein